MHRIILIHGAGGGGWEWRLWRPAFNEAAWLSFAPDLQPVAAGLAATTLDDYIGQIIEVVQAQPEPPVLIGASMGGLIALKVAEQMPVRALVLVNSVPPASVPGWPLDTTAEPHPDIIAWSSEGSLESTRASMPEADDVIVRWAHTLWRDESGAAMDAAHDGVAVSRPLVPTVVVIGMDDADIPSSLQEHTARFLGADVLKFQGVSHVGALLGRRAPMIAGMVRMWLAALLAE